MFVGGNPLIKGLPAKLLLVLLRAHLSTGKALFFLSELKADRDLDVRSNLEARLDRLAKRLEARVKGLSLVKLRGCRRLECGAEVVLSEI